MREGRRKPRGCRSRRASSLRTPGTAVQRLFDAGAVMLGVTNCDEFAMGSSTENSSYFPTHNPWSLDRVPGGSSGGSAAAVAPARRRSAWAATPAVRSASRRNLCGVIGMKPTYGREPLRADRVRVEPRPDRALHAVGGGLRADPPDDGGPRPADSPARIVTMTRGLHDGIEKMRLGVPREYFEVEGMEPGVRLAIQKALNTLEAAGAELVDVSLPHTDYGLAAYYIIAPAECSSNLARFDGVRYGMSEQDAQNITEAYMKTRRKGFGAEVRRRVMLGTYALSSGYYDAYYLKAQKVRTLIKQDFDNAFANCDAIVSATSPTVAFPIGSRTQDPLSMYLCDVLTLGGNLAGLPGISVPCGMSEGLPVGLQVLAPQWREDIALRVARAYELAADMRVEVALVD